MRFGVPQPAASVRGGRTRLAAAGSIDPRWAVVAEAIQPLYPPAAEGCDANHHRSRRSIRLRGEGQGRSACAALRREPWVVRCGGPNSGHTVWIGGARVVLRQIPAAAGHPNALLLLSAGCAIDEDLLIREADQLAVPRELLVVDPRAVLISQSDRDAERGIVSEIASTGSGTGAALIRRMSRAGSVKLAEGSEKFAPGRRSSVLLLCFTDTLTEGER